MSDTESINHKDPENNSSYEEESVLNSSFSSKETSVNDENADYMHEEQEMSDVLTTEGEDEDIDYHPGDLVDLRGLFDEETVDPSNNDSSTLDFDEIPDDIDIDEPIEIEELSKAGKIMNVVVQASLIIFGLIVLGFIINAGLVVGAVLSSNFQTRVFVDVSDLEKATAKIDATIMTETTNFGSFIEGELDPEQPVKAIVYLSNEETAQPHDAICEIEYQPPKDKDKIKFNGGVRNVFHLHDMKLKLNPNFDASRLSGFMEPKNGNKFHERYPNNLIIYFSAGLRINSFLVPIPYEIEMFTKVEMNKTDPEAEKKKLEKMKAFDFNPKFVDISSFDKDGLTIKVRQPMPKFYAPPFYKIAVHMPEMNLVVKQFTNTSPYSTPDIKTLFNTQSSPLVKAKISPFRMIMCDDDMTPNILDIEAKVEKENFDGLINVLKAMRDDKLGTLAFLFASDKFNPDKQPKVVPDVKPAEPENPSKDSKITKSFEGCSFPDFMKTFWGRQAYPVGDKNDVTVLPSLPETYDPSKNSAVEIEFKGLETTDEKESLRKFLKFNVVASTHFIITEYKLPLLMLTGQLPPIQFKMLVNYANKQSVAAKFIIKHINNNEEDKINAKRPLGNKVTFEVLMEIIDFKSLSHFALKFSRMSKISAKEGVSTQNLVGKMFKSLEGAEIAADFDVRDSSWISKLASVYNMKFDLSGERVEFIYSGNGKPVIPEKDKSKKPKDEPEYSQEAEDAIVKSIDDLLGISFTLNSKEPEKDEIERHDKLISDKVEELKKKVGETELNFCKKSKVKYNFAVESKIECEKILSKSKETVVAKPVTEVVKETDVKNSQLEYHEKLVKVRNLMNSRIALRKKIPIKKEITQTGLFTKIDSTKSEMNMRIAISLNESHNLFNDHVLFTWDKFEVSLADEKAVELSHLTFERGKFKYSLADGSLSRLKSDLSDCFKLYAKFGPKSDSTVKTWMKSFREFVDGLMNKKVYFISYNMSVISSKNSVTWLSELPTAAVPALPSSTTATPLVMNEPGFFDNLTKSYFDFIGYGFYRLIFHAILPNPDECPSGSSILNVELDLPEVETFLFANASTRELWENTCVASINTARPMRIWTQIVDGVLCNMYAVADGLIEQEMTIQARIDSGRANSIIKSFKNVLSLRKSYGFGEVEVDRTKTESPLLKFREKTDAKTISKISPEMRYALATAVPISLEFLNFERMIKIVDALGDKKHVKLGPADLTTSIFEESQFPSLFNVLINALAGNFPVEFNSPEQMKRADTVPPRMIFSKEDQNIILKVDVQKADSEELVVKTSITMPDKLKKDKPKLDLKEVPYVAFNSLKPEERFHHPIIRWGTTELIFAFHKFKLSLKLSAGEIQVTNDGSKVLFEALKDFHIDLSIKAAEKKSFKKDKDILRSKTIRQFFNMCQKFISKDVKDSPEFGEPIQTTSVVSYGPNDNQNFYFLGQVDIESFFLLQGVIIRKMFSSSPKDKPDEFYDPKDDPTAIDFEMLISLGGGKEGASRIPVLAVPCFFTNLCSTEQLGYTMLNKKGLLTGGNSVNATLTIGKTFGPLAASIAAGFSSFLPIFYMDVYPGKLKWQLLIPDDQVLGMEINGLGMVYGKADAINIDRTVPIPYPNCFISHEETGRKKDEDDSGEEIRDQFVLYGERDKFSKRFFKIGKHELKDPVNIKVQVQVPDSLPHLLRNMFWSLFFLPMKTLTLHPPIIDINSAHEFCELSHAPISVAISDSMEFKVSDKEVIKPSILTRIFAAFIEESSSTGMEMHKQNNEPSSFRTYYSIRLEENALKLTAWIQFPWALGSIGFNFGSSLGFKVFQPGKGKENLLIEGEISEHYMIGKIARMRIDLCLPKFGLSQFFSILEAAIPFYKDTIFGYLIPIIKVFNGKVPLSSRPVLIEDIPLDIEFNVDNNFIAQTELIIPKSFFKEPEPPTGSAGNVILTATGFDVKWLLDKYKKTAPQAVACIYDEAATADKDKAKQSALWTQLDLTMTRVYYREISKIKPGDTIELFLQLRTFEQVAVCGLLEDFPGLAVKIEYIKPAHPLQVLFYKDSGAYDREYYEAKFYDTVSVFRVKPKLNYTGRYKIYAALIPKDIKTSDAKRKEEGLKTLRYKEIKFTEIYVQNAR